MRIGLSISDCKYHELAEKIELRMLSRHHRDLTHRLRSSRSVSRKAKRRQAVNTGFSTAQRTPNKISTQRAACVAPKSRNDRYMRASKSFQRKSLAMCLDYLLRIGSSDVYINQLAGKAAVGGK